MSSEPPITDARIFQTMVTDGSSLFPVDTIEYEGKFWLVPRWLFPPSKEWREPERLICISNLGLRDHRSQQQRAADFSVLVPLPKALFFDPIPTLPAEQYVVIAHPRIRFPMPALH